MSEINPDRKCETCAYFTPSVCRRYPPSFRPSDSQHRYARVSPGDWCGEWAPILDSRTQNMPRVETRGPWSRYNVSRAVPVADQCHPCPNWASHAGTECDCD